MTNISAASKLTFFKAESYEHDEYTFDASCAPRPHFCMGLLLEGTAEFSDSAGNVGSFTLHPGEMVFVPITSRYVSHWHGEPKVRYISIHFAFDYPGIFTRHKNFLLQKYVPENSAELASQFEFLLRCFDGADSEQLLALSEFFRLLGTILPELKVGKDRQLDLRISRAIEYIENNYAEKITVDDLAAASNMSASRFFPAFREALGVTPVDYLNHYRINRSIELLINKDDMTIESISDAVGFESSTYFRRVFKRITGKNPKDYRGISGEM